MITREEEISGRQVRMARAALRLSAGDLAALAGVGVATVGRVEGDDPIDTHVATLRRLRITLEQAGVRFSAADSDIDGVSVPRDWAFAGVLDGRAIHRPSSRSTEGTLELIEGALHWTDLKRIVFFTFPTGWRTRVPTGYRCNTSLLMKAADRYFLSDLCPLICLPGHVARTREVQQVLDRARDLGIACEVIVAPLSEDLSKKKAPESVAAICRMDTCTLTDIGPLAAAVAATQAPG